MVAGLKILSSGILAFQTVKFITLLGREIPYFEGHLGSPKVNECPESQELSPIVPEMEILSTLFKSLDL